MKRIHISKFATLEPFSVPLQELEPINMKPKGLWYGINNSWIEWCEDNMPEWVYDHHYEIEISSNKMLFLNSDEEILEFSEKYKSSYSKMLQSSYIDWNLVCSEYGGIEIPFYSWDLRLKLMWYYGWDCASGCIWDSSIIKNVIKIK